jgi:hypothetical protein
MLGVAIAKIKKQISLTCLRAAIGLSLLREEYSPSKIDRSAVSSDARNNIGLQSLMVNRG